MFKKMGNLGLVVFETPSSTLELVSQIHVGQQSGDAFGVSNACSFCDLNHAHDLFAITLIERLFKALDQLGVVGESAAESAGQMPPVELVSGSPADGPGQGGTTGDDR